MPMNLRRKYKYTATNKQDSLEWERLWLLHNGLPIRTELVKRKITVNSGCLTCEEGEAALEHLFTKCPFASALWFASPLNIRADSIPSVHQWLKMILEDYKADQCHMYRKVGELGR